MSKSTSEGAELRILRDQVRLYKKQNEVLLQLLDASNQEKQHLFQEQLLSQEREKRSLAREQQNQQRIQSLENKLQHQQFGNESLSASLQSPEMMQQDLLFSLPLNENKSVLLIESFPEDLVDLSAEEPVVELDFLTGDLEFQQLFDAAVNGDFEDLEPPVFSEREKDDDLVSGLPMVLVKVLDKTDFLEVSLSEDLPTLETPESDFLEVSPSEDITVLESAEVTEGVDISEEVFPSGRLKMNREMAEDYFLRAVKAAKEKKVSEAISLFSEVEKRLPDEFPSKLNLAILYTQQGDYFEAQRYAQQALAMGALNGGPLLQKIQKLLQQRFLK